MKRVKGIRYLYRRGDVFVFRRGVPLRFRDAFSGRSEVIVSLGTSHMVEARYKLARELAKFDAVNSHARRSEGEPPPPEIKFHEPSPMEIEAAVRSWLIERKARAAMQRLRLPENREAARSERDSLQASAASAERVMDIDGGDPSINTLWLADSLIEKHGWSILPNSDLYHELVVVVSRGQLEASNQLLQDLQGKPRRINDDTFGADQYRLDIERERDRARSTPVGLMDLFDSYVSYRKPKASTVRAWRRQIAAFSAFLGHDNARAVTQADLQRWKDHLLTTPSKNGELLSARTVKDTYLSAVKAVFASAVENLKLTENPTKLVKVRVQKAVHIRDRGFTDDEAVTVLKATLLAPPPKLTAERALARRWVPWFLAYTGARVNEITQMRRQDVAQIKGIWTILITPEAGTVKNNKARLVPIHPAIIEQGFIDAISGKSGPLFYDLGRRTTGSAENPQPKKVGEHIALWVREIGVSDPLLQPNHGWRHRFKTLARLHKIDAETRDAIQGHVPRTEGEGYGDQPVEVLYDAIRLLPRYEW